MGAAKRQQKYKAAETKAVKATSNVLQSRMRASKPGEPDTRLQQNLSRDRSASIKADAVKNSLKAPSTKMKKAK